MPDYVARIYLEHGLTFGSGATIGLAVAQSGTTVVPTTGSNGLLGVLVDEFSNNAPKVQLTGIAPIGATLVPQTQYWATANGGVTATAPTAGIYDDNYLGWAVSTGYIALDMVHMRSLNGGPIATAPLTKTYTTAVDAMQEVAQNTLVVGNEVDISDAYCSAFHIWHGISNETAHNGTRFMAQVSSAQTGNEDWVTYHTFIGTTGTGNDEVITNNPAAVGTTVLTVASTTGYTTNGNLLLLEDVSTFANSEFIRQKSYVTNTSVTTCNGTARAHAQNSILHNLANSVRLQLPSSCRRVRLLVDNCYHTAGATIAFKTSIVKVTGV